MANTNTTTATHADVNRKFMAQMEGQLVELQAQYELQLTLLVEEANRQKSGLPYKRKWNSYSTTDALNLTTRAAAMAEVAANVDRQIRAIETMKDLLGWLPKEDQ
jgi:hypothetical protein